MFLQHILLLISALVTTINAKNILLTNDDSFAATNIRATYYALKEAGHNTFLVAPVSQRSGWGGKFDIPYSTNLLTDGEFSYVKQGQPSWGHESFDNQIWYFNGTPSSSVAFALDYVLPNYFNNISIDLLVSGPNEGTNLGPQVFTLSGTIGATYYAVERGIPGIAFSGSNPNNSFYKDTLDLNDTNSSPVIYANKVVELVNAIFETQGENSRALPLSVGLNVNLPLVGEDSSTGCTNPGFALSRISGSETTIMKLYYNATSGLFTSTQNLQTASVQNELNGDLTLPSENTVLLENCVNSVSVFSIDYDANLRETEETKNLIEAIL